MNINNKGVSLMEMVLVLILISIIGSGISSVMLSHYENWEEIKSIIYNKDEEFFLSIMILEDIKSSLENNNAIINSGNLIVGGNIVYENNSGKITKNDIPFNKNPEWSIIFNKNDTLIQITLLKSGVPRIRTSIRENWGDIL